MGRNPKATTTDYTNAFTAEVQDIVVRNIYDQLFQMRTPQSIDSTDLNNLKEALPKECVAELYQIHQKAFESDSTVNKSTESENKSTGLLEIQKILAMGVENAKSSKTFNSLTETLRNICKDPQKYKTLDDIIDSEVANPWVIAYTWSEVQTKLKNAMVNQCKETLKDMAEDLVNKICISPQIEIENRIRALIYREAKDYESQNKLIMSYLRLKNELENIDKNISLKEFNDYFTTHEDFLEYTYENIENIGKAEVQDKITEHIITPIFTDDAFKNFSDNFLQNQVTAGVGLSGFKEAKTKVETRLANLSKIESLVAEQVVNKTRNIFKNQWRYKQLSSYLNWDRLGESKKQEMKESMFEKNVLPSVSSKYNEEEKDELRTDFSDEITNFVSSYRSIPNPHYKKKTLRVKDYPVEYHNGKKQFLTFTEKLELDITEKTTEKVYDHIRGEITPNWLKDLWKDL